MDIRTSCLGVLSIQDASGYEIRKAFEDGPFSIFAEGGFGSIYPALKKLEEEGLVTSEIKEQNNRPQKNIFKITAKGRLALLEALSNTPAPDKFKSDFLFSMFFAEFLSPAFIEKTIDDRIKQYEDKIEQLKTKECTPADETDKTVKGCHFVHAFGIHLHEAACQFLEENKHIAIAASLTGSPKKNTYDQPSSDAKKAAE